MISPRDDFQFYIKDGKFHTNKPGIPHIRQEIELVLGNEGSKSTSELSDLLGYSRSYINVNLNRLNKYGIVEINFMPTGRGGMMKISKLKGRY